MCPEDLKEIARYTLSQWGKKKRDSYLHDLDKRFSWLTNNVKIGKQRPDIKEGYYCYLQGSHLIFYILNEIEGIDIIGIPHKAMDIVNYFSEH
ncbi:MAG: type II toxin-antitoxin system RelE/ParE family toxin [Methylococcaceae bacterium]